MENKMKEYIAKKVASPLTIEDERWEKAEVADLSEYWEGVWPKQYNTVAKLLHSEEGLYLKMETDEWPIKAHETEENGVVCLDSCMEFFFTPNTKDKEYINFEVNVLSFPQCGLGVERFGRSHPKVSEENVTIQTSVKFGEGWSLFMFISAEFLRKYFSSFDKEMLGNFYKCGNETVIRHYSVWNMIETEVPDYHRPEYFGKIILSDEQI